MNGIVYPIAIASIMGIHFFAVGIGPPLPSLNLSLYAGIFLYHSGIFLFDGEGSGIDFQYRSSHKNSIVGDLNIEINFIEI
jgi:hypothetical protein